MSNPITPNDLCGVLINEDNMSSNSAFRPPSQQSVKTYVDNIGHQVGSQIKGYNTAFNRIYMDDWIKNDITSISYNSFYRDIFSIYRKDTGKHCFVGFGYKRLIPETEQGDVRFTFKYDGEDWGYYIPSGGPYTIENAELTNIFSDTDGFYIYGILSTPETTKRVNIFEIDPGTSLTTEVLPTFLSANDDINCIRCLPGGEVLVGVGGDNAQIVKRTIAGIWNLYTSIPNASNFKVYDFQPISETKVICLLQGTNIANPEIMVLLSEDSGDTWSQISLFSGDYGIKKILYIGNGVVLGISNSKIYKIEDNFSIINTPVFTDTITLDNISLINSGCIMVTAHSITTAFVIMSYDLGITWSKIEIAVPGFNIAYHCAVYDEMEKSFNFCVSRQHFDNNVTYIYSSYMEGAPEYYKEILLPYNGMVASVVGGSRSTGLVGIKHSGDEENMDFVIPEDFCYLGNSGNLFLLSTVFGDSPNIDRTFQFLTTTDNGPFTACDTFYQWSEIEINYASYNRFVLIKTPITSRLPNEAYKSNQKVGLRSVILSGFSSDNNPYFIGLVIKYVPKK